MVCSDVMILCVDKSHELYMKGVHFSTVFNQHSHYIDTIVLCCRYQGDIQLLIIKMMTEVGMWRFSIELIEMMWMDTMIGIAKMTNDVKRMCNQMENRRIR